MLYNSDEYNKQLEIKTQEYINILKDNKDNSNNFSWVLDCDKDFIKEDSKTVRWGIPTYPTGDVKNSSIYLCLFNPSIDNPNSKTGFDNIKSYAKEHDSINDCRGNFLIDNLKKGKFNNSDDNLPPRNTNNILYSELKELNNKNGNKDLKDIYKLINKENAYYSFQYFRNIIKNMAKNGKSLKDIEQLSICNLEFCPYRSTEAKDIKPKKGKSLFDMPSVELSLKIIIDRIEEYINGDNSRNDKPFFIFRSYNNYWGPALKHYINKYNVSIDIKTCESMFWMFCGQSARISENNIISLIKYNELNDTKDKMKKESWNEFNNSVPDDFKDVFHS
ncbi:hypothetical protein [Apilactobacillus xinyiensis]|uniref:hypothetical protein n=1 Tax=Apilactobacillus xinyiensis TaxID=2841032 RepID=UPI00200E097D|nr:hypothetical protein [Apilactobacillus xinyiensis]MCL0330558.1 hypothetical protein [Apilactobacillus xinyiensis]